MRPDVTRVADELEKVLSGKRQVIEKALLAVLSDGHILLEDVPGVGKTTLAVALSRALGLTSRRVQFTPDVLPSDLVGFSMVDRDSGSLRYHPGALCGVNLVLGDEINRAASKTQSALLEAMEERQITVDGQTRPLERPFLVIATQNVVGAAGTQPLPFAQLERFMMRLSIGYPDAAAQMALLKARQTANPLDSVEPVLTREQVLALQAEAAQVTVKDAVLDYITRLTEASRTHPAVEVGISPRGALSLCRAAKALACAEGRDYATGEDVSRMFADVCGHRVLLKRQARNEGLTVSGLLGELLSSVPAADRRV
ncbi:MAG: MoxR family ATPase [Clostridia bacterium]|nr:MoxR family ATPase [Clostridia bacterium]